MKETQPEKANNFLDRWLNQLTEHGAPGESRHRVHVKRNDGSMAEFSATKPRASKTRLHNRKRSKIARASRKANRR